MKEWELPDIPSDKIAVEDAQFIFTQAAKRLEGTITNADLITTRSINVITLLAGVITATLAYPIANWAGVNQMNNKQITAALTAVYALIVGIILIKNILPTSYLYLGSKPRDLCVPELFTETDKNMRLIKIYLVETKDYNKRIEHNWKINDERLDRYRGALIALYLMPCILALVFLCLQKWG